MTRTEITPKDFKDINRHRERLEKTNYDNNENEEDEEMDYEDDGSDAYEAREYAKEYEQPSYLEDDYYDGN